MFDCESYSFYEPLKLYENVCRHYRVVHQRLISMMATTAALLVVIRMKRSCSASFLDSIIAPYKIVKMFWYNKVKHWKSKMATWGPYWLSYYTNTPCPNVWKAILKMASGGPVWFWIMNLRKLVQVFSGYLSDIKIQNGYQSGHIGCN
jgi:hypothetical protein